MDLGLVRQVHDVINAVHRLVYFVPEAVEEYGALGVTGQRGYFGSRAAAMGPVPAEVVVATFYNFGPAAVVPAMDGLWELASPAALQAARFAVVRRACERLGLAADLAAIGEARALLDEVVAAADLAGKPLGAANAAVALPADPFVALWQW